MALTRKNYRRLAKFIAGALLFTWGGIGFVNPSVVMASTATVEESNAGDFTDGSKDIYGNNNGTDITVAADANGSDNTVNISAGSVKNVYGAYSKSVDTTGNAVNIGGGQIKGVSTYPPSPGVSSGYAYSTTREQVRATNNTVNINAGQINTHVSGGYAKAIKVSSSGEAYASDNTVNIYGGQITGDVYGGYAYAKLFNSSGCTAKATNNTVNILTAVTLNNLYGGKTELYIGGSAISTGNTLNVFATGVSAKSVSYFQTMNFFLPSQSMSFS